MLKTFEDFYVKKDYRGALLYLEQHRTEIPKDLWHYNLGVVYSNIENWPSARFHFLLAEEAGFTVPELYQNKVITENKLDVQRLEKPLNFQDHLIKTSLFAKDEILTSISLIFLLVGLLILKQRRTLANIIVWIVSVLAPIALSVWINSWPRMFTLKTVNLAEGPSAIFDASEKLPAGIRVVVKNSGDWSEVIYPSRFHGWIKRSELKKLE